MAKVEFFGQYEAGTRLGFLNTQIDYRNLFVNGADLDFRGSAKKYTITDVFTDTFGQDIFSQNIIKGKLKANLPFNKRKIKSVESFQFDPITGEQISGAKYSGLKNLTLDQFIDSGVDSLKKALSGNDQIFGNAFQTTVLSGYKGDDELFIETFKDNPDNYKASKILASLNNLQTFTNAIKTKRKPKEKVKKKCDTKGWVNRRKI